MIDIDALREDFEFTDLIDNLSKRKTKLEFQQNVSINR